VSGYVQARETYQRPIGLNGALNRVRLGAGGSVVAGLSYRVTVEYESGGSATTAATPSLRDAYVRWDAEPFAVTVGQFKTPFTREFVTPITTIETADRATVVDSLAPKRDIGVMGEAAIGAVATLAVGVFNGEGQNRPIKRDSAVLVVARATVRPISQVTLGADAARFGGDSTRYDVEAGVEVMGVSLRGEYLEQSHTSGGANETGWYAQVALRVLPMLQLVAKQEDYRRPRVGLQTSTHATTAGVNVERGRARWLANVVWRTTGSPSVQRVALVSQLQVRF
jgi:hypothetical protein